MAHMIETMAYAGDTPWHRLGVNVVGDLSPEQMLVKAGLDWKVEKVRAYADIDGTPTSVGWSALVRDSDKSILDIVSDDWVPNQNSEAFEFFNEFCEIGDMSMETAGSIDKGRIVWGLARVKESFEVFNGDRVDSYLLFTNPHRFGQSIDVRFTPIRVVCNNTLTMALHQTAKQAGPGRANSVRQSHRSEFNAEKVKTMLGVASHMMEGYKKNAELLGAKEYTDKLLKRFMREVFPKVGQAEDDMSLSDNAARAVAIVETQPGAEFAKNTWWQAFNAVTYTVDHLQGRTDATRLKSAWYGTGRSVKQRALGLAVKAATKGEAAFV